MSSADVKPHSLNLNKTVLLAMAISAFYGFCYLLLSAWSSHNNLPSNIAQKSLEIALNTQIIHALAILCLGGLVLTPVFQKIAKPLVLVQYCWILGVFLFSGMIYLKHLVGVSSIGLLTPLGGLLLIMGWLSLGGVFVFLFCKLKFYSTTEGQNK